MRSDKVKQIRCISEHNAYDFQEAVNAALADLSDPQIIMDQNIPFTCYIIYTLYRSVPSDVLEVLEMIDGESHQCQECPYFTKETDMRKRWGFCSMEMQKKHYEGRACSRYYLWKRAVVEQALQEELKSLPFIPK